MALFAGHDGCNVTDLTDFEADYGTLGTEAAASSYLAECVFSYFDELSDCCKESIETILLPSDEYFSCADIDGYTLYDDDYASTEEACNLKDKCQYDDSGGCINLCYDNVWADCATIISGYSCTNYSCIDTYAAGDLSGCCTSSLALATIANEEECVIPVAGYWDHTAYAYDYSICDDATIAGITNTSLCGTTYDNTDSGVQLGCLYTDIDLLPDGCCKNAIEEINTNSYIYSKECEIDTQYWCGYDAITGIQIEDCFNTFMAQTVLGGISPKCLYALGYCASGGSDWPDTPGGFYSESDCDYGYSGTRTRYCNATSGLALWEDSIDTTNCTVMTCDEGYDATFGQWWPETEVGHVTTVQGGYDSDNNGTNQVNTALKTEYYAQTGSFCDLLGFGNTYFARRKCEVDPLYEVASWKDPLVECRSIVYSWTEFRYGAVCDLLTSTLTAGYVTGANLIGVIPWNIVFGDGTISYLTTTQQIELSQQYCESSLDNCAAFTYDNATTYSYFFDYCGDLLLASDLQTGTDPYTGYPYSALYLDTFADTMTTYITPLQANQFTAGYCSAVSYYTPDQDFIAASETFSDNGIPDPFCFNNLLWLYYIDPLGGVLTHDSVEFTVPYANINVSNTEILSTSNSIAIREMYSEEDAVDFILAYRDRLDEWKDDDLSCIPGGFVVQFYSQYIGVQDYMLTNLIFVTIAVIGVGFIFLLNPIAVIVCILCNVMMIVEVYGFSHYVGLRINGVLVLNIVIAIGLTMEFTAHIGRAFVLTSHSGAISFSEGQIRMKKTLKEMFVPVSLGAITTIIGIAPISAAAFPYFKLYYFNLYVIIVAFGWLNGVIFQPILLSFYPPKPFEMDQKKYDINDAISTKSMSSIDATTATGSTTDNAGHSKAQASIELGDNTQVIFDENK
eukprot:3870_1